MHRPNPFLVAIVSGIFGALGCLGIFSFQENQKKPENASERCLYAAVSAYPNWAGPGMLLDNLDACKGVSEPQKNTMRQMMKDFYESSLNR